jgi:PAS domain S-box-containing protein
MKTERKKSTHDNAEILVAEDSITQAIQIKHLLESHRYNVIVAQNGLKAMYLLLNHKPSLVITDILMPEMNGYELCKKIKSNKNTEDIPVILLTRLSDPEEIIEGLSCGADSFITKPYNEKYFLSHIEKILYERNGEGHKKVPFGTEILFRGIKRFIQAEQGNVIKLMLNIYEGAVHQNEKLVQSQEELKLLNERLESTVEERTSALFEEIKTGTQITKKLKESEEKFRSILENSADAIFIVDQKGRFLYSNKAVTNILGYTLEEIKGKPITYISPADKIDEHLDLFGQLLNEGKLFTELELLKKDGSIISTDLNTILLPDGLYYGSLRDITERKLTEKALKDAKVKAEANDKLKTTFLNNISHEVRTPLNGILGFAEIMSHPDLSDEDKDISLSMLYESSDRLLNTINNYMDISLITSGNMILYKKNFVPAQILKELFGKYKILCAAKNLELLLNFPEQSDNLLVNSDPEIFRKITSHLLNNAVKFTEKGSINYGYLIYAGELELFVKDTGIGIGKKSLRSIFECFVKEDREPLMFTEGSGLGLSIAKGMIEIIGGKTRVESEIGIGSCFSFKIPLMIDAEIAVSDIQDIKHKKINGEATILIAEDDEINFFYLNTLVIRETGAKVLHASNGREAISLFKANPGIALILMDINMPEIDGLEATRQIKLIKKEVPIIAITAYAMSGDEERILAAGCDGYLSKPISKEKFLEKMVEFIKISTPVCTTLQFRSAGNSQTLQPVSKKDLKEQYFNF